MEGEGQLEWMGVGAGVGVQVVKGAQTVLG